MVIFLPVTTSFLARVACASSSSELSIEASNGNAAAETLRFLWEYLPVTVSTHVVVLPISLTAEANGCILLTSCALCWHLFIEHTRPQQCELRYNSQQSPHFIFGKLFFCLKLPSQG